MSSVHPVAAALLARQPFLVAEWAREARTRIADAAGFDEAMAGHLAGLLQALSAWIGAERPDKSPVARLAQAHARRRLQEGAPITQVIAEYGLLRSLILEGVEGALTCRGLQEALDYAIGVAASHYRERDGAMQDVAERDRLLRERDQTEAALRESDARLRAALSAGGIGTRRVLLTTMADTRDASLNRILGLSGVETTRHADDFEARVHPDDRDAFGSELARAIADRDSYDLEVRIVRPDGSVRWVRDRGRVLSGEDGSAAVLTGALSDITEERLAMEERLRAERLTATVVRNATLALLMTDHQMRCTFMNEAAETLTGWTAAELTATDRPLHDLIHHSRPDGSPLPLGECEIDAALREAAQRKGETTYVRKDGTYFPAAFMTSPVLMDGIAVGTVLEIRDLSEEKRSEAERDLFIGALAHDLRNPLNVVQLAAYSLPMTGAPSPQVLKASESIVRNTRRMTRLIDQLLAFSRARLGAAMPLFPEPMSLAGLCREVIHEMLAAHPGSTIALDEEDPGAGVWDRDRLGQVVQNLVGNAVVHGDPAHAVRVVVRREGALVLLEVGNQGVPIPEGALARLFDPFARANSSQGGTGLGLYIVRQIVDAHRGTVTVTSGLDGTRFAVRLPAADGPAQGAA